MKTKKKSPVALIVGITVGLIVAFGVSYFFMNSSLKEKILDKVVFNDALIEQTAKAVDKQCPMTVDEMTTMEHCKFENNRFIYQYKLNCNIADIDFDIIRQNLAANIPTLDQNFTKLVKLLIKKGDSLVYEYFDAAGDSRSIEFSATDLQKIIEQNNKE